MDATTKKKDLAVGFPVPDWKGSSMPPRTGMEGQYCRLEVLDSGRHALELDEAYAADPEDRVWVYLADGPFDDFASFLAWLEASAKQDDPLFTPSSTLQPIARWGWPVISGFSPKREVSRWGT